MSCTEYTNVPNIAAECPKEQMFTFCMHGRIGKNNDLAIATIQKCLFHMFNHFFWISKHIFNLTQAKTGFFFCQQTISKQWRNKNIMRLEILIKIDNNVRILTWLNQGKWGSFFKKGTKCVTIVQIATSTCRSQTMQISSSKQLSLIFSTC